MRSADIGDGGHSDRDIATRETVDDTREKEQSDGVGYNPDAEDKVADNGAGEREQEEFFTAVKVGEGAEIRRAEKLSEGIGSEEYAEDDGFERISSMR